MVVSETVPWIATSTSKAVQLNASNQLEEVAVTSAPQDLGTWAADQHYIYDVAGAPANSIPSGLSVESLGVNKGSGNGTTYDFPIIDTLTINSGFLSASRGGGFGTVQFSGGSITSGNGALHVFGGSDDGNMGINIQGDITGDIDVHYGGKGFVSVGGGLVDQIGRASCRERVCHRV